MKKIVSTDKAPKAIGPYNQAVIEPESGLIFTAGQIALDPASGVMVEGGIKEQAHRAFANLKGVLEASGSEFEKVLKVTVFLKDMGDFVKLNEVYSEYFKVNHPARSAVEVSRLPKDALIEIELIAHV